jgi:hypothetical protein
MAKKKEGLVGVPCGAETKLRVWYLMCPNIGLQGLQGKPLSQSVRLLGCVRKDYKQVRTKRSNVLNSQTR